MPRNDERDCSSQTHIDIVEDFDEDLVQQLQAIAEKHDFVIWEDRKFADIGMPHLSFPKPLKYPKNPRL